MNGGTIPAALGQQRAEFEASGRRTLAILIAYVFFGAVALATVVRVHPSGVWSWAIWVVALVYCWNLGHAIWRFARAWQEHLLVLYTMRQPVAVILFAAFLLYSFDQFRELGIGLMTDHVALSRLLCLFLALVYWAVNSWHSARLGIWSALKDKSIGEPAGARNKSADTPWIFWGPRLLGVCAHLLAAVNLALSAINQPEFQREEPGFLSYVTNLFFLAWLAPIFIVVLTYALYRADQRFISERDHRRRSAAGKATLTITAGFSIFIIAVTCGLWAWGVFPQGFLFGSCAISLSAVFFLAPVSYFRRQRVAAPDGDARQETILWRTTALLFVVALVLVLTAWFAPAAFVMGKLGSMVMAYSAFGAILACLNFLQAVAGMVSTRLHVQAGSRRAFGALAIAGIVLFCVIDAWLAPFHRVRTCREVACDKPGDVDQRMSVDEAAKAWYAQAKPVYDQMRSDRGLAGRKTPMLIVATAGGGIRAAYWTAAVLEKLENELADDAHGYGVRPFIFAISGVSGGSVGATAFSASLADDRKRRPTSYLTEDFLAPALASWLFKDTFASVFPDHVEDRAGALEQSFESASHKTLAKTFLSLFRRDPPAVADEKTVADWWRPILLLNATHEETGKRIIAAPVRVERDVFIDALDELHVLQSDVPASTAAINSARFTFVSPAGDLGRDSNGDPNGSIIDGGYFENYGALTALEIGREAESVLGVDKVKLVVLMITSDPEIEVAHILRFQSDDAGACHLNLTMPEPGESPLGYLSAEPNNVWNSWLNDFEAPLRGYYNVRTAQGNRAAVELALKVCSDAESKPIAAVAKNTRTALQTLSLARAADDRPYFAHLAMCRDKNDRFHVDPPLGWMLSKKTGEKLEKLIEHCGNRDQLNELELALGKARP